MTFINIGRAGIIAAAMGAVTLFSSPLSAQTSFEKFATYDAESTQSLDYSPVDEFYRAVSIKSGDRRKFRYDVLGGDGVRVLGGYVEFLTSVSPSTLSKDEQLAYWLNLRNLLIIRGIAADSPLRSLKKARGDFDNPGEMWTRKRISVEDVSLSIDDIEKKILLANWRSPDLIYGLFQGAKGGPAFAPPVSFSGATVHQQLQDRGVVYVNSRGVIRTKKSEARVPAVYDWYKEALFEGNNQNIITHIQGRAAGKLAEDLSDVDSVEFNKMNYSIDQVQAARQRQFDDSRSGGFTGGSGS